ncbi:MAG: ferredoxin [Actinobacteria bacterium]|nr:MAG: ferredoxin [Actinomycetota bacterium]
MAKVWIDADECMGAGTCAQVAPQVFHNRGDGLWAVKESGQFFETETVFDGGSGPGHGPDGFDGKARVPDSLLELVIDAAQECPGECIYVEA